MRAADADRTQAVEVLQEATGKGYLSLEEFEVALDRVFASRTYSDLDAILAGVPGAPKPSIEWAPQPVRAERTASPGSEAHGSVGRNTWSVPAWFSCSPLRAVLCILFALFLVNLVVHAWPLPLIVFGVIWWRRSHGHGWPGHWRRRPAEFV